MPKLRIYLEKTTLAACEITTDIDDAAVAQRLEEEKLKSEEYENSLKLDWDSAYCPVITGVDQISSDEAA